MGKIEVPETYETLYYHPEKILCLQTARKHTAFYIINAQKGKGYETKIPCGHLGLHEEKIKQHDCFMRVHDSAVVNMQHVLGVSKDNIIRFDIAGCDLEVPLDPALRPEFKRRMQLFCTLLLSLLPWLEDLLPLAA